MCLILFAWNAHPDYSLVVAANRDEFYVRPTLPLDWWEEDSSILAGKDAADVIGSTGTWMGISNSGRFSALTNIRAPSEKNPLLRTRGELTTHFLKSDLSPKQFIHSKVVNFHKYNGFNLLIGELNPSREQSLQWVSNRELINGKIRNSQTITTEVVSPGVYGLSNAMLDTPWPKVKHRIAAFTQNLAMDKGDLSQTQSYLDLLRDNTPASDDQLPSTGVSLDWERVLSSAFIQTDNYGTRSSSVLRIRKDGQFQFTEQTYNNKGALTLVTKEGKI